MTTTTTTSATARRASGAAPGRLPGAWTLGLHRGVLELKQFFRRREQVVFTFAFPVVFLALFASIFRDDVRGAGVTASQLYAAAMIASGVMSTSFQSLGVSIALERDEKVLRRLRGTPMPPAAYFLGKLWLVLVSGIAETVLLLVVGTALFDLDLPTGAATWLTFAWVLALGLTGCALLGIAISSVPRSGKSATSVVVLPFLVLQFISGVFISIDTLPDWMLTVGALFPLKWMCQGFRGVFLPDSAAVLEQAGSWEYGRIALVLGAWCVGGLVLCLLTFRWKSRRDG
ncbi:ABC transporter permease [Streptomyces rapamycinicus]|uniref:Transport permease protein n=2 Tax=Streptomyces rapamycinicus TaxID=1226757 RepID=A0A0A0NGY3_STRRN|nr:ABC transporter permease [Streptomyces rapamycinicus]AGP53675.1 ABC transporter [Streptomyces rapamycinicus NRRL 5491]MBB4781156.1 ABC-2 type transport system permease protein [Streptomyces rapamycinicus]RLV74199.1 ABC transporter [Streptomyces rapamycinicus NRRL 5491]UTO61805.1 ABC transporter permease [Streptomyces rapamycinicus]UTP29757.1 ABC transporter permease [Streptomyces rapamycinicus NRRL 5491]